MLRALKEYHWARNDYINCDDDEEAAALRVVMDDKWRAYERHWSSSMVAKAAY